MPRYAANLTMLWQDVKDPLEKLEVAAQAGFTAVERVFVYDLDVKEARRVMDDLGLELVLFDPYPGDWAAGDRGVLCRPGRETELLESVQAAVEHAHILGTRLTNVLAGVVGDGESRAELYALARDNLEMLLDRVDLGGVTILLESVCNDVWKGSLLDTVELAAHLAREIDDPRVGLQLDAYHAARAGVDIMKALDRHLDITRHVQIADHPGRHQPGTGGLPLNEFLTALDDRGYPGHVGLEYLPKGPDDEALAWLPMGARAS